MCGNDAKNYGKIAPDFLINRQKSLAGGGEGGIRTLGTIASTPDFESGTFDHSATSPFFGCAFLVVVANDYYSGVNTSRPPMYL